MWNRILLSIIVLVATFLLQSFLSFSSRNQLAGGRWGREDYLLWHDWLASALIALFAFLIKGNSGAPIGPLQLWALAFVVAVNIGLPNFVNNLGYEGSAPYTLTTLRGIILPNTLSALAVAVAVAVGVDFSS